MVLDILITPPPKPIAQTQITHLDNLLKADNRGQFYLDLAKIYQANGASSRAIDQILDQAQITTGGGAWGGAAALGNAYAQQHGGANYNVTLDKFSKEIAQRLLDGIKLDLKRAGGTGIFIANEIQGLDASVWNDKGMINLFPGNINRFGDYGVLAWNDIPANSTLYQFVPKSVIENAVNSESLMATAAMAKYVPYMADKMGIKFSDYGLPNNVNNQSYDASGKGPTSASGKYTLYREIIGGNDIYYAKNNQTGNRAVVIDDDAGFAWERIGTEIGKVFTSAVAGVGLGVAAGPLGGPVAAGGAYVVYNQLNQPISMKFQNASGQLFTINFEATYNLTAQQRDLIFNQLGFRLDADGIRFSGAAKSHTGMPQLCFAQGTLILMADGTEQAIEHICVGDEVMAFDGLGVLQPRRVMELYTNMAHELIELSNGTRVTSEHPYLCADGVFRPIHDVIADHHAIVMASGEIGSLTGTYTSCETPEKTYNFAVEELHSYVAGGVRVHNMSVMQYYDKGAAIINIDILADGSQKITQIMPDGTRVVLTGKNTDADPDTDFVTREETYGKPDGSTFQLTLKHSQFDANNRPTDAPELSLKLPSAAMVATQIASTFGAQLAGILVKTNNPFIRVGAQTLGGVLGEKIAQGIIAGDLGRSLLAGNPKDVTDTVLEALVEDSASTLGKNIVGKFEAQAFQVLGSIIMAELADALDLDGFAGQVFTATAGTVTGQLLNNLAVAAYAGNSDVIFSGFKAVEMIDSFASLGLSIAANAVAAKLVNYDNQAEALMSAVMSAALARTFDFIPVVGPAIGSFLGTLAGSALYEGIDFITAGQFGSWFTDAPYVYRYITYNHQNGNFEVLKEVRKQTGNFANVVNNVRDITDKYLLTLNGIADEIGGRANVSFFNNGEATTSSAPDVRYHTFFGYHHGDSRTGHDDYKVMIGRDDPGFYVNARATGQTDMDRIMRIGLEYELRNISFYAGDLVKMTAHEAWKSQFSSWGTGDKLPILLNYLSVAEDYRTYSTFQ